MVAPARELPADISSDSVFVAIRTNPSLDFLCTSGRRGLAQELA
jgi:hypothetical protein